MNLQGEKLGDEMIDKAKDLLRQVGFSLKGSTYRLPLRTIGPANARVFMNLLLRHGGRVGS